MPTCADFLNANPEIYGMPVVGIPKILGGETFLGIAERFH